MDGKVEKTCPVAAVFRAPIRPDVVRFVHTNLRKNDRQPYAVNDQAGMQHSAVSWGTGRAVARVPRIAGSGTHRSGQGAFANMCRKGRMFAPTKIWRRWHRKVNLNQRRYAVVSALAASAVPSLVMARGHRIEKINEVPLVVSAKAESITQTKAAIQLLKSLNAYTEIERVIASKTLRAGSGKARGRRFRMRRGPLVIYDQDNGIVKAFRNIPGIELASVHSLNLLTLAPGGHLGRFCIWTESAFAQLDKIFGTFATASAVKKNYLLPSAILTNADISRILGSEEVKAVVKPAKTIAFPHTTLKKNPLRNKSMMAKMNPLAALQIRRTKKAIASGMKLTKATPAKPVKKAASEKRAAYIAAVLTE